ncbi:MAG: 50S ribosomal protein L21 [candidate division KSB1 bacterium]|nr:50S ribosomal protein L21 [candidate division KSB1 bacterium]
MYAIVDIAGKQLRVEKGKEYVTPRLPLEPGSEAEFDRVLLLRDEQGLRLGAPAVEGAKVKATVVSHGRAPKIVIFKKKRRKGYKVKRGHRQPYSVIRINEIVA